MKTCTVEVAAVYTKQKQRKLAAMVATILVIPILVDNSVPARGLGLKEPKPLKKPIT